MDILNVNISPLGLAGTLRMPRPSDGLVVFAHGSGSGRLSPRNLAVAEALNGRGMATLLFDLLTLDEEADRTNVFDIPLLARRLVDVVHWVEGQPIAKTLPLGLFRGEHGGRRCHHGGSDTWGPRPRHRLPWRPPRPCAALERVLAPTLLIVGGADYGVIPLNELAFARLQSEKAIVIVPGATHLFPEPGALEAVIDHAARWFDRHFSTSHSGGSARSIETR